MPEFGQKEYWEARYKGLRTVGSGGDGQPEDTRDWYMGYAALKAVLKPYLKSSEVRRASAPPGPPPAPPQPPGCRRVPPDVSPERVVGNEGSREANPTRCTRPLARRPTRLFAPLQMQVLFIGCGMSELPEQLHDAGFKRVAGVDYVQGLVDWMKWRNKKRNGLLYLTADLTDATAGLPVSELIVDKAALDAVVCTHHSRDKAALAVLRNAHRSLEPGGTYMLISHAGPDDRLGLLQKLDWKIQVKSVERQGLATLIKGGGPPKPKVASVDLDKAVKNEEGVYFMYLCRKPDLPTPGVPD